MHLADSGYVRMSSGEATLFADVAAVGPDYLPGHAHADTLSFEFSLGFQRIIVNGGTSVYGTDSERQRQRGTASHSTVVIDGMDSSEVWGGFRVARRAKVITAGVGQGDAELWTYGSHDGYRHLPGAPTHRRQWRLSAHEMQVVDEVLGDHHHEADIVFPLAPGLIPRRGQDELFEVYDQQRGTLICNISFSESGNVILEESTWHPRFGVSVPTWRVRIQLHGALPFKHVSTLRWAAAR